MARTTKMLTITNNVCEYYKKNTNYIKEMCDKCVLKSVLRVFKSDALYALRDPRTTEYRNLVYLN